MTNNIEKNGNVHVISLDGNLLSEEQGNDLMTSIDELIESDQQKFVIDLSDLNFINSSGLSFLLRILTKARRADGDVVLTEIPEQLSQLLVITKLNAVFRTEDKLENAIAAMQ